MGKSLFIAEKPSVARSFEEALGYSTQKRNGYIESDEAIFTWCVGHLVEMSYPEVYDPALKKWSLDTIPFIPEKFLYQVKKDVKDQFDIVSSLLKRPDVDTIYVCTDSGREGEYIYRLVDMMANVTGKEKKRVWLDSFTNDSIVKGIKEAKDLSAYDNLSDAAYLRAKEDYLMGINFSRVLSLKYAGALTNVIGGNYTAIPVGRVMTCVLGLIIKREREIRSFEKTNFYKVAARCLPAGLKTDAEWKLTEGSAFTGNPDLYKENGFTKEETAVSLIAKTAGVDAAGVTFDEDKFFKHDLTGKIEKFEKKSETKRAPRLYNLADLQAQCAKLFKITPDQTLSIIQELYEKKLVTYPRTDARVLSTAVAAEIGKNLAGNSTLPLYRPICEQIMKSGSYKTIGKNKYYTDDKQITDHYAIIPTGQGLSALKGLSETAEKVYEVITRRFLAIFMEDAEYDKIAMSLRIGSEVFFANFKAQKKAGYLDMMKYSFIKERAKKADSSDSQDSGEDSEEEKKGASEEEEELEADENTIEILSKLKKGDEIPVEGFCIREGETKPPERYTEGTLIKAMEGAGRLIEDDELRSQIRTCGIGTSATRAGIIEKLKYNKHIVSDSKLKVYGTLKGEIIYDIVSQSIYQLLSPELTASWEKGLNLVADGEVKEQEYMSKLTAYVTKNTEKVKLLRNVGIVNESARRAKPYYDSLKITKAKAARTGKGTGRAKSTKSKSAKS